MLQRSMTLVLRTTKWPSLIFYINNTIRFSEAPNVLVPDIEEVLQLVDKAEMAINF